MASGPKYEGWMGLDSSAAEGNMVWQEYEPKAWEETDVEIKITHCGICGTDIHTLRSGWGPTLYPCCVGHEIVGHAVRVGSKAEKGIRVGDRVGVGAQSSSCLRPDCEECSSGLESYCPHMAPTYNAKYTNPNTGQELGKTYGGYANFWRGPSHFVIPIPDAIPSAEAAPMLCGGITTFAPLIHHGAGPGKRVGIVGVGGLGHFGLLWAKALDCDKVVAISRTNAKKEDATKMGADEYIATDEDKDWNKQHARSLDLIVCTVSSPKMPLQKYLQLLRTRGQFIQVGAPEDHIPGFNAFALIAKGAKIGGSSIGNPKEIETMLKLAAEKKVKPWIQERPLKEANQAVVDFEVGKPRYRYTLINEANAKL
ncbi:MAG: hypothetical protein M1822_006832 [Bathelium mastoideum]|nr:MAG: hypothetical protein M1822_006832 [Bathelium mastoideum]